MAHRLRVNPIRCDGRGLCAELFPERVRLDDWGYPIVDERPFAHELLEHGGRAVAACPRMALLLEAVEERRSRPGRGRGARR